MMKAIEAVRVAIRSVVVALAGPLNTITQGRLHPNTITIVGFLAHAPIAWLIGTGTHNVLAALLLVVFGLFDTLDGSLARLQKRDSAGGMLLDASTDRMKEVLLYSGAAYVLAQSAHPTLAVWAVAACGASLCVSYVKAKGEAAIASTKKAIPHTVLNKLFKDGLLTFEIRMTVLIFGLLFGQLAGAIVVIAVLASCTAFGRLIRISKALA